MSAGGWAKQGGGFYSFDHGHLLLWTRWANPEARPAFERRDELARDHGQARADWMIENSRNLCLYPNVYLMDQFSSQIRIARPIDVNRTEITIYCIAPKGESSEARAQRIRQYEDFFNVSAWPRRTTWRNSAPASRPTRQCRWLERHVARAKHWIEGADDAAREIDLAPALSGVRTEDEGLFVLQHQYWQQTMIDALAAEQVNRIALTEEDV